MTNDQRTSAMSGASSGLCKGGPPKVSVVGSKISIVIQFGFCGRRSSVGLPAHAPIKLMHYPLSLPGFTPKSGVPDFGAFKIAKVGNIRFAVVKPAGDAAGRVSTALIRPGHAL